jgi:hypothetical protein
MVAVHTSSFGFDNALESFDSIYIAIGAWNYSGAGIGLRRTGLRRDRGGVTRRPVTHFPSAPGFLRLVFGFLFQLAHFFNGLENQDLIDSGITGIPQALLGRLNLPSADGWSGAITIWIGM